MRHGCRAAQAMDLDTSRRQKIMAGLTLVCDQNHCVTKSCEPDITILVYGPSAVSFSDGVYPDPKAMSEQELLDIENAFVASIERSEKAGCKHGRLFDDITETNLFSRYVVDFIEIHGAHGYLLHSFVSPLSNIRHDPYGGQPLENRLRYFLRLVKRCRDAWPSKPLFVRISASDWADCPEQDESGIWKQWGIKQSTILVGKLKEIGVDLIDCSSGGNWFHQKIPIGPGYQVCTLCYAETFRHEEFEYNQISRSLSPKRLRRRTLTSQLELLASSQILSKRKATSKMVKLMLFS
jgi:2,4-dienoyl-CoA reductase-like NADH-dependent reductase (Old Yellow Enzyme family)